MRMDVKTVKRVEAGQSVSKTTLAALDDAFGLDTGTMRRTLEGVDDNELTPRTPAEKAIIESRYLSDEEKLTAVRALRVASEQQVRRLQRKQNNNPNGAADSNGSGSKSA